MLHCDPTLDVGQVGVRAGPLTGAADALDGPALRPRRPHLAPAPHRGPDLRPRQARHRAARVVSRRLDPRAGVSVVWGMVRAGAAHNVIPESGHAAGTVRMLDPLAWAEAEGLVAGADRRDRRALRRHRRGRLPPRRPAGRQRAPAPPAARRAPCARCSATAGQVATTQSLGGEDFGWYLERVPGAMVRLGTRTPGGPTYDLHQGNLRIDERSHRRSPRGCSPRWPSRPCCLSGITAPDVCVGRGNNLISSGRDPSRAGTCRVRVTPTCARRGRTTRNTAGGRREENGTDGGGRRAGAVAGRVR